MVINSQHMVELMCLTQYAYIYLLTMCSTHNITHSIVHECRFTIPNPIVSYMYIFKL